MTTIPLPRHWNWALAAKVTLCVLCLLAML
jgi:hypothetical protein